VDEVLTIDPAVYAGIPLSETRFYGPEIFHKLDVFKARAYERIVYLDCDTLVLGDVTQVPIASETIYRNGDAPGQASAAKIGGGAVAGAILGAILGGGKGAAIGGAAGAGAGTATVMAGDRSAAVFQSGAEVTARIVSPVTVTVEK